MSTSTLDFSAVLVSDLPPAGPTAPTAFDRLRGAFRAERERRELERHLRFAGHAEGHDLLAQSRRR